MKSPIVKNPINAISIYVARYFKTYALRGSDNQSLSCVCVCEYRNRMRDCIYRERPGRRERKRLCFGRAEEWNEERLKIKLDLNLTMTSSDVASC